MSKKKNTASKSVKKAKPAKRATTVSAGSPVTLDEAKSIVGLKPPRKATSLQRRSSAKPVDPIGLSLQRREEEYEKVSKQRIREYEAVLDVMTRRGVKGLSNASVGKKKRRATGGPGGSQGGQPLSMLAEGDSWFEYPYPSPFFGGGLIPRLESRIGVPILNLAKAGDEVRNMMGVKQRTEITTRLTNGARGQKWDVLLFSGGGNDIVGEPMALWIKDHDRFLPPDQLIDQPRLELALGMIKAGYEDLIALRNSISPTTHIFFHSYDFAIPDGRGACHLGPWLKPAFDLRKIPSATAFEVVKSMLKKFADMLTSLESSHSGVTFINTQGTLTPKADSWHNELHPSKAGFNKFADLFHSTIKAKFPNRVL